MDFCKPSYVKYYLREKTGKGSFEIQSILDNISMKLRDRWIGSGYLDYGIYRDPEYIYDMAHCYFQFTRASINSTKKVLGDLSSILDYYNGIGLSTIQIKHLWPNAKIAFFNDVKSQKKWMIDYCKRFRISRSGIIEDDGEQNEAVFLFEVLEHNPDPEKFFLEKIHHRIKKYLVFTAPFSQMWGGHFPEYHGVDSRYYKKRFKKFLSDLGYKKKYIGFNERPIIYENINKRTDI
jgi:hypothetical protein